MKTEYDTDPTTWLNLDNLRVLMSRVYPSGNGATVANIQGGRVHHPFEWKFDDDAKVMNLSYIETNMTVEIKELTPEFLAAYPFELENHFLLDGVAPLVFAAHDALEGRQTIRIFQRSDGNFDSMRGGDAIGENGIPSKCNGCRAFAVCPFRLQGLYTTCDPGIALQVIEKLKALNETYRKWRQIRPGSTKVSQSVERAGPYAYSKRQTLLR